MNLIPRRYGDAAEGRIRGIPRTVGGGDRLGPQRRRTAVFHDADHDAVACRIRVPFIGPTGNADRAISRRYPSSHRIIGVARMIPTRANIRFINYAVFTPVTTANV